MASESKHVAIGTHHVDVEVPEGIGTETRRKFPVSKRSHLTGPYDSSSSSDTNVKCKVHIPSRARKGIEHCLSKAIQANAEELADSLPFKDCELADEVVKRGCITEDECKDIREKRDRKTQVRAIILLVKRRSYETMETFLDASKIHCPSIVDGIWQQYRRNVHGNRRLKPLCPLCNMKYSVGVHRVVDALWSEEVIDDTLVEKINSGQEVVGQQSKYWDEIIDACYKNSSKGLSILFKALERNGHYNHIARDLRCHLQQNERLFCTCSSLKTCCAKSRTSSINSGTSVEPTSSYSDDDLTETDVGDEPDTMVNQHIYDDVELGDKPDNKIYPNLNYEGKGSTAESSANVKGLSKNTFDQPQQNVRAKRRENNKSWWRKLVFICGPPSVTTIDEEVES